MLNNLKAMLVVLFIAMAVFKIARPICQQFMADVDFMRRRNIWLILTAAAFASPNIWLFMLVAMPFLAWGSGKDTNPVAFYIFFMNVVPPTIGIPIPAIGGINEFFDMNGYRILAFSVLVPAAFRLSRTRNKVGCGRLDFLLLSFIALQLVLMVPYESFTNTVRRGFLVIIDVLLLYFVTTRSCTSKRSIIETMASFCLLCAIFAPISLFETLKGWLLYEGIGSQWGDRMRFVYLFRSGLLRAQVSAGNALPFGYMMAIAFGFWLYLRSRVRAGSLPYIIIIWMWIGLFAAYSRGPWLVAVVIIFANLALGPNGATKFIKAMLITGIIASLLLVSPIGDRIIDNLPFIGTVDASNIIYRQQLIETSLMLIRQNPFFGTPYFLEQMEHMRQGQGIIDVVNVYLNVALTFGLVGLALFLSIFLDTMWRTYRKVKQIKGTDSDLLLLGVNLLACMMGTLLMMGTGGLSAVMQNMFYMLIGLAAAYAQLAPQQELGGSPVHPERQSQRENRVMRKSGQPNRR